MPKKPPISQEEISAFYEAVKDIAPLKQDKIRLKPRLTPKVTPPSSSPEIELVFQLDETTNTPLVAGDEFIIYKQVSVSNKILRNLKKGQYNVEARLDLHGMTIDEAKIAVDLFLQEALQQGVRLALIIHGKGHQSEMPILKNKLNHWLRYIDPVLAFCGALPSHGGHGATYVLLKTQQRRSLFE